MSFQAGKYSEFWFPSEEEREEVEAMNKKEQEIYFLRRNISMWKGMGSIVMVASLKKELDGLL